MEGGGGKGENVTLDITQMGFHAIGPPPIKRTIPFGLANTPE